MSHLWWAGKAQHNSGVEREWRFLLILKHDLSVIEQVKDFLNPLENRNLRMEVWAQGAQTS